MQITASFQSQTDKQLSDPHRDVTFNRYSTHGQVTFTEMQHLIAAVQTSVTFYRYVSALNFTCFAECSIFALNATFLLFSHTVRSVESASRLGIDIRLAYNPVPKKIPSFAVCNFPFGWPRGPNMGSMD